MPYRLAIFHVYHQSIRPPQIRTNEVKIMKRHNMFWIITDFTEAYILVSESIIHIVRVEIMKAMNTVCYCV